MKTEDADLINKINLEAGFTARLVYTAGSEEVMIVDEASQMVLIKPDELQDWYDEHLGCDHKYVDIELRYHGPECEPNNVVFGYCNNCGNHIQIQNSPQDIAMWIDVLTQDRELRLSPSMPYYMWISPQGPEHNKVCQPEERTFLTKDISIAIGNKTYKATMDRTDTNAVNYPEDYVVMFSGGLSSSVAADINDHLDEIDLCWSDVGDVIQVPEDVVACNHDWAHIELHYARGAKKRMSVLDYCNKCGSFQNPSLIDLDLDLDLVLNILTNDGCSKLKPKAYYVTWTDEAGWLKCYDTTAAEWTVVDLTLRIGNQNHQVQAVRHPILNGKYASFYDVCNNPLKKSALSDKDLTIINNYLAGICGNVWDNLESTNYTIELPDTLLDSSDSQKVRSKSMLAATRYIDYHLTIEYTTSDPAGFNIVNADSVLTESELRALNHYLKETKQHTAETLPTFQWIPEDLLTDAIISNQYEVHCKCIITAINVEEASTAVKLKLQERQDVYKAAVTKVVAL